MTDKELQDAQRSLAKQHAALREQRGLIARETDKRVVVLNAKKKVAGIRRLDFTREYEGPQSDSFNAITATGDDRILRVWVDPSDNKLYSQMI